MSKRIRFSRGDDDNTKPDAGSDELKAIERMQKQLGDAIEGVRTESRDMAVKAVSDFAEKLEKERSRKPPIPSKDDNGKPKDKPKTGELSRGSDGGFPEVERVHVLGDAADPLYRRMERGRSISDRNDFRAARNPKMDKLTGDWCRAVIQRNVGERIRLYDELNGRYVEALGYSRAALLEGAPDADSGLGAGSGGELLPLPLAGQLILERDKASVMRGLVNVFPMTSQTQRIPVLPTASAATRAENTAFTDNTPNPDSALLAATDLGVLYSAGRNFLEDTAFNMANQLTVVAGGAIGAEEDEQIITSTGANADITEGLDAATITTVAETTAESLGYIDVVALYYAVPKQYRRNAMFFGNDAMLQTVMQVVDDNGRPIFLNQFNAPTPMGDGDPVAEGRLLGKPIYEVPGGDLILWFGDPMWYAWGQRAGIRVDVERDGTTGLTQWSIDERVDGRVIPTSAVGTNDSWRKIDLAA